MKFGDRVVIKDGSKVDGSIGVVYRMGDDTVYVLLEKEVLWPVKKGDLILENSEG